MYECIIIILILSLDYSLLDCGCNVNRNSEFGECRITDTAQKYSSHMNKLNTENMVLIEGETFEMGTDLRVIPSDFEGPVRNVTLESFYLDKYEVSNQDFQIFVSATGYKTEAEEFGNSFIFEMLLTEEEKLAHENFRVVQAPWWIKMKGVTWEHPDGPKSNIRNKMDHPVAHVSWNDANAFCMYLSKRLPTEEEWEMGCRGKLRQKLYPWGNKLTLDDKHWTNIWQGEFPKVNTVEDGYLFTAPVTAFPPNKYGLYNMAGNVWEWTSSDWSSNTGYKVTKGGSYMCHKSYCWRYRCSARTQNTIDSSTSNIGFRCAADHNSGT